MRTAKDFFTPLAVGAPAPLREIPPRPSRAIHFFDPSNQKMAGKVPDMVGTVDVLLGNLEDAVKAENKDAARQGLVDIAKATDFGPTQLWTRVNALDSPWVLDDLTTLVTEIGDKLDVIMVPKVQGAEDIHYVDRLVAQLEARAKLERPILLHAILETARGVANIEEICGASPRMQGLSLGPADLAADRRMKTTRVGGGHPGYLVRQDPPDGDVEVRPPDLPAGSLALHHRPHGRRLRDARHLPALRAVRRHRRRGRLRGPVPQRLPARLRRRVEPAPQADRDRQDQVFSPSVEDVKHARRVVAAMGDGTGAVMLDGKMEDDASTKQCLVMVELAEQLAAVDPELKAQYDAIEVVAVERRQRRLPPPPLRALHAELEPEGAGEGEEPARPTPSSSTSRTPWRPDAKPSAREAAAAAAASGEYGRRELTIRVNAIGTEWHDDDLVAAAQAGPDGVVVPKVNSADEVHALVAALEKAGAPERTKLWAMIETPVAILRAHEIAAASDRLACFVMGTNDLVKELYAEHVPGRGPVLTSLSLALLAARAAGVAILDGVYNNVKDAEGFAAECRQGREFGFDGKTVIHPGQVEAANEAFSPVRAGDRGRPRHPAGVGGRGRLRCRHLQRPHGREPARRVRPPYPRHRRGHRRAGVSPVTSEREAAMSTADRVFVARLAGMQVFDPSGDLLGRVRDAVTMLRPDRQPPRLLGLVVEVAQRHRIFVPMGRVTRIEPRQVVLASGTVNMRRFERRRNEILVLAELLDRTVTVREDGRRATSSTPAWNAPERGTG